MVFPTIPTSGGGRILTTLNTAGGATKTFPNLSSLTKNAGDLLIAICIEYDGNSTNAEFSSWGGSFTEFVDQAGTATMAIGCAWKISTGSETGTFTVTTADTSANDSILILMSIPGAHATTAPTATAMAVGTSSAADPAALDPANWGAEDTLWIAVAGSGEDATTGSYTGVATAPTNYASTFLAGITADVVGGVDAGLAFRQLNASSENVGTWSVDTSNARNAALLIAVRPATVVAVGQAQETETARTITPVGTFNVVLKASGVVDEVTSGAPASEVLGAITFAANSLVLVLVGGVKSSSSAAITDLRASASGLTFTEKASAFNAAANTTWARALTAPHASGGSTTITIDSNGFSVYGLFYAIYEITGHDAGSPVGATASEAQSAILDGAYSITLNATPAAASMALAAFFGDTSAGLNIVDPGTGWTEDVDIDSTGSNFGVLEVQRRTGSTSTTVTWNDIRAGASVAVGSTTAALALEIKKGTSGQTVTVTRVSETDLVQAITRVKARTVVQATETDLAQAVTRAKTRTAVQATETDLAQPIARTKIKAVGLNSETDLAQPITRVKTRTAVQATETDLAQAVTRKKTRIATQATEIDLAQIIRTPLRVNRASETDLAQPVGRAKLRNVAQSVETDIAQPIGRIKTKIIGQISETDLAQPIGDTRTRIVGQVVETDLALPIVGTFNPASLSGLKFWFQAADLSGLADGAAVTTWASRVGSSNASQATGSKQPSKQTVNGRTVVRFDGTADRLTLDGDALTATQNIGALTIFLRVKTATTSGVLYFGLSNGLSGGSHRLLIRGANAFWGLAARRLDSEGSVTSIGNVTTIDTTAFHNVVGLIDYANTDAFLYVDEAASGSNTSFITAGNTDNTASLAGAIGSAASDDSFAPCDIEAIGLYDRILNSTELAQLDDYLDGATTITATVLQATETDLAQSITRVKTRAIGQPSETDLARVITAIQAGGGGQTVTVTRVTETDLAQAITRVKTKAVAQPSEIDTSQKITRRLGIEQLTETDLAQAITRVKRKTVTQVTATNTAQPVGRKKTFFVGTFNADEYHDEFGLPAVEVDQARPITRPGRVTQVSETDLAQAITRKKTRTATQLTETDLAQVISRRKTRAVGQPSETDTARPITVLAATIMHRASETDLAQLITTRKTRVVTQTSTTDLAQVIGRRKTKASGQSLETDLAQPIGSPDAVLVTRVVETDLAQVLQRSKLRAIGQPSETDLSQHITRRKNIGQAAETDLAQPILVKQQGKVLRAVETDLAQPITSRKTKIFLQATETDSARPVTKVRSRIVGQVVEPDTAQLIIRVKRMGLLQTSEVDSARPIIRLKSRALGLPAEVDNTWPIVKSKRKPIGLNLETDVAQLVGRLHSRTLTQPLETDAARQASRVKTKIIGRASETDTATLVFAIGGIPVPRVLHATLNVQRNQSTMDVSNLATLNLEPNWATLNLEE